MWRYRLGVRTEDSQSSNPGSIPGSATKNLPLSHVSSSISPYTAKTVWKRGITSWAQERQKKGTDSALGAANLWSAG